MLLGSLDIYQFIIYMEIKSVLVTFVYLKFCMFKDLNFINELTKTAQTDCSEFIYFLNYIDNAFYYGNFLFLLGANGLSSLLKSSANFSSRFLNSSKSFWILSSSALKKGSFCTFFKASSRLSP